MPVPDSNETEEISPVELQALLAAGEVRLIDCREEDEHALCHIAGATLVPLREIPEKLAVVKGEGERPVVIYCHHGMRSLNATQFLRARGLAETFSLRGGIDAWAQLVDPDVPRY
jgi:rhodanese-related sulfurtransferase